MNDAQMSWFRDALEAKLTAIEEQLAKRDGIKVQRSADPADEAQLALERELVIRALDREFLLLGSVRSAIQRIHEGDYGVCQSCNGDISEKRLVAAPWAMYCIQCQERIDARGREQIESYAA